MNTNDKKQLESLLRAWGCWVRQGRTFPNLLGYPTDSTCCLCWIDERDKRYKKNIDANATRMRLVRDEYGRVIDLYHIAPQPVNKQTTKRTGQSKVPIKFSDDTELHNIDLIVQRISWDLKLMLEEIYINQKSVRDVALILRMNKDKAAGITREAKRVVFEFMQLQRRKEQQQKIKLRNHTPA